MATKTYRLGEHDFVLEFPSTATWDRFADSGDDPAVLFVDCVKAPDGETLARILARKPAYKHTLRNLIGHMAGADMKYKPLDPDPEKPGIHRYQAGDHVVAFRSATEVEYDDSRDLLRKDQASAATGRIVKACLLEPTGVVFDAWCETEPGLKFVVSRMIYEDAGAYEAALEKK